MEDPELVDGLLRDVVFLEAVGVNPVLVHGGGKAISRAMADAGLEASWVGGLRVTDEAAVRVVEKVLGGELNPRLVETINRYGGRAKGISGLEVFKGSKKKGRGEDGSEVDLGFVGQVESVDTDAVMNELVREVEPVVTPLGAEVGTGHPLNVNADLAASALAVALKAPKLIYLSDVLGVMGDPADGRTLISTVDGAAFERLSADGTITGGMLPKVESALEAIGAGVGKVHLVDGRIKHSLLLEVFTRDGIGTQIVA